MGSIEFIARGLAYREGKILVAHKKGESNTFLPGGHVKYGESALKALFREFREETGIRVEIGEFIGALEHGYVGRERDEHHEVNLIFEIDFKEDVSSKEPQLEFSWVEVGKMTDINLLPNPLPRMVTGWLRTRQASYNYSR